MKDLWTKEQEIILIEKVNNSKTSTEIAYEMERSRQSIVSKVRRMGFKIKTNIRESWDKEKTDKAIALRKKGKSNPDIALALNVSVNSVIARMRRIGAKTKEPDRRKKTAKTLAISPPKEKFKLNKELFDNPKTDSITLLQLTSTTCRWPVSEDNKLFCGHHSDKTYCEFHEEKAYSGKKYVRAG